MKSKAINRIKFISLNAIRQILVSVFSMIVPFLVIHYAHKEIWGSFVSLLLYSLFSLQIINWGNKEYLLRTFSMKPNKIKQDFSQILFTRLPLVLLFSFISFLFFPLHFGSFVFLWVFGKYLNHSVEVLIVYEKKFKSSTLIEIVCFILFCITFYILIEQLDLYRLLILYSSYQFIKGIAYFFLFKNYITLKNIKFNYRYYKTAFPFFLLSILGFLASKADVYLIENLGNKSTTAAYQVINSLLVFTMSISALLYAPFTKNIYRNNHAVIQKTKKALSLLGLIIVPIALLLIHLIVKFYLNLNCSFLFYSIAFLYVYPSFIYGLDVVNLFKQHKEKIVVHYLAFGAIANIILSSLFLYLEYGMFGALFGSALAQIIVLLLFKYKKIEQQNHHIQP